MLEGELGEGLGVFLGHPKLQGLPAVMEVPGPDGHGPDAGEMRKLRELHARAMAGQAVKARCTSAAQRTWANTRKVGRPTGSSENSGFTQPRSSVRWR